jgi:3D (Asp-Asp-Asp) domain-containing protein
MLPLIYALGAKVTSKLITAYCACILCCGHTHGITKSGRPAKAGRTAACSREMLNKTIWIEGVGERTCDDTGSKISASRVDVYFTDHQAALKFGVKRARVYTLNFKRLER